MKKTLLALLSLTLVSFGFSQTQIENGDFESGWDDISGNEDEPHEWNSLKTATPGWVAAFAPVVAFKALGLGHNGSDCIRLKVINSSGVDANGIITNGRVFASTNPDNGYVFTEGGTSGNELVFNDKPDSLVFWYQHTPISGDKSKIEIILHDNSAEGRLPETGSTAHWIGRAKANITATTSGWTRFSTPFNYYNCNTPDYLLIVVTAGDSTIAVEDTELFVDDIELIYNPISFSAAPTTTQNININIDGAPITATEQGNASNTFAGTREWKYSAVSGGPYTSFTAAETGASYTPNFAAPGIYYVVCESDFTCGVMTSDETEIVVVDPVANTATVTPSATQTLLTDEDGNLLTVTETPSAADSREWMLSATSGSGYASFAPVETGLTYLPNFAALGTYYIICQSDFAGDLVISNEVEIIVPSSIGIDEDDLKFNIQVINQQIILKFDSQGAIANFNLYTVSGQKILSTKITSTQSTIELAKASGIYIYQLICGDKMITGKVQF
jgi:hypothetical protein